MASGEQIGGIFYTVEADTSKLVNSSGDVDKSLDNLNRQFAQTDRVAQGTQNQMTKTASAVKGLGQQSWFAQEAVAALAKVVAGLVSIRTATILIQMAEGYNEMSERIQMATRSTREYRMVQERLLANANDTYRSLAEAQEMYIRTADSLRSMGYSTSEVLDITDSMSYLFVTNAASVDRANTAITAYTKSINKGKVESDSWESIIAAAPSIINDIAEASGKSAAEIRKLGAEGKLTAQMLNEGLRQSLDSNKAAADGMQVTVKDALVAVRNNLTVLVGEANKASGTTDGLAQSIKGVAEAIQNVDVKSLVRELDAINDTISMIGDGFDALADLVDGAADSMNTSVGRSFSDMALTTAKEVDGIATAFKGSAGAAQEVYRALAQNIPAFFENAYNAVLSGAAGFVNELAALINKPLQALGMDGVGKVNFGAGPQRELVSLADAARRGWQEAADGVTYYADTVQKIEDREFLRAVAGWAEAYEGDIDKATESTKRLIGAAGEGSKELQKAMAANRKVIDGLAQSLYEAGLSGEALAVAKARASLNEFATPAEVQQVEDLARAIHAVAEAEKNRDLLAQMDPLANEQMRFQTEIDNLRKLNEAKLLEDQRYLDLKAQAETAHDEQMRILQEQNFRRQSEWNDILMSSLDHLQQAGTNAITGLITGASNGTDAVRMLGQAILQEAVGSLVQMGIQYVKNLVMGQAAQAAALASTVAAATASAAAWAPAAALASLASFGANSAPAMAGMASTVAAAKGLALLGGRQYGGPVGAGKMYRINETGAPEVLNTASGRQYLLPNTRGQVVSNKDATSGGEGSAPRVTVNLIEDASRGGEIEQRQGGEQEEIIDVFVADIRGGGKASRALESTYGMRRQGR